MKILLIILSIILFLIIILSTKIVIYLTTQEKTEIQLKIGQILRFKLPLSKLLRKPKKNNTIRIKKLLKTVKIEKLTLLLNVNVLKESWLWFVIAFNLFKQNLKDELSKYFKEVNNIYIDYNLVNKGLVDLKMEVLLSFKVINIFKLLFKRGKNESRN